MSNRITVTREAFYRAFAKANGTGLSVPAKEIREEMWEEMELASLKESPAHCSDCERLKTENARLKSCAELLNEPLKDAELKEMIRRLESWNYEVKWHETNRESPACSVQSDVERKIRKAVAAIPYNDFGDPLGCTSDQLSTLISAAMEGARALKANRESPPMVPPKLSEEEIWTEARAQVAKCNWLDAHEATIREEWFESGARWAIDKREALLNAEPVSLSVSDESPKSEE